jgi:hypothetical protein
LNAAPRRVLALFLFFLPFAAVPAAASVKYDVPIDWVRIETRGDYEEAYETSLDPSRKMFVLIRTVDTEGASAEAWAETEGARMKREGAKTGKPLKQFFGATAWTYVDWKSDTSGETGRRYFTGAGKAVVEVSLLAKSDVFRTADASKFDAFFESFSF